jgi:micrococcal nuclease
MRWTWILTLVVGTACNPGSPTSNEGIVEGVVDGDTIDIAIGGRDERVRLIGLDTPETHVDNGPPECYGPEAAAFTAALLPAGTAVRLERDVVGRDDYGRLLAYVYPHDDAVSVNETILRQGYATPLRIPPNEALAATFVAAAGAANAEGLGLWAACGG